MSDSFDVEASTLSGLLKHGQGLYVPIYQRQFTWQKDDVDRLLDDLLLGASARSTPSDVSMFIGSIILLQSPAGVDPSTAATPAMVLHVIDGQQRLTSLALVCAQLLCRTENLRSLLHARSDLGTNPQAAWISARLDDLAEALLGAIAITVDDPNPGYEHGPRLIRQSHDQWGNDAGSAQYDSDIAWYVWQVLQQVQVASPTSVPVPTSRPALRVALQTIDERLQSLESGKTDFRSLDLLGVPVPAWAVQVLGEKLTQPTGGTADSDLDSALRLATFTAYVLKGVQFIDVRPDSKNNAFALFEPINTTGQLLTPLETLVPAVIQFEGGVQKYLKSPSRKHMALLDSLFDPTVKKSRDAIRQFVNVFALADSAVGRLGTDLQSQRRYLRKRVQGDLAGKITPQRSFIKALADDARFYVQAIEDSAPAHLASASESDRLCFKILQTSNHSISYSLLARYQAHDHQEYLEVMRAVTAFWVLWRTSRSTTRGIDDVHRKLMRIGYPATSLPPLSRWNATTGVPNPALPPASEIKDALKDLLKTKGKVASRQDWIEKVTAQDLYETAKTLTRVLLLAAHDDSIPDPSNAGQIKRGAAGCFPTMTLKAWDEMYTVEHIAPQNRKSGDSSYQQSVYRHLLMGHLGNLTLLPPDINNLVENRPWTQKRDFFAILGEADPTKRLAKINAFATGTVSLTAQAALTSANYMPLTAPVAKNPDPIFRQKFLAKRGENLAGLAWDRLYPLMT